MKFIVSDDVKKLGLKIVGLKIEDIDNKSGNKEFEEWRSSKVNELLNKYDGYDIKNDEVEENFYEIHSRVGVPRRKNPPASENLIKALEKKGDIPHINKAVDIYNLISIESKLCLGAHDIDKIKGDVNLKLTDGTEKFIPLGSDEEKPIKAGEYSFVDGDNDIICWLDIRQVDKTKVTEDTKSILYFVIGNEKTKEELLNSVANEIIERTTSYCGGKGTILDI